MRKFIISDIHGNGNVYKSIMNYLDNISKTDKITLYINGDLIDYGPDSGEILLDIKNRIQDNKYKIVYLGGNHELMMHMALYVSEEKYEEEWCDSGGHITEDTLLDIYDYDFEKIKQEVDFISNLKIYQKFEEKLNGKNILLVHAGSPYIVLDNCRLRIKHNNVEVNECVWKRKRNPGIMDMFRDSKEIKEENEKGTNMLGNINYFTIVGHTPNENKYGYEYDEKQNVLNIDGGNAYYVRGFFECDHTPLVEIKEEYLEILTFNNNNEIIYGNYFDGKESKIFSEEELNERRKYLNKELKIKKLVLNEENIIDYED